MIPQMISHEMGPRRRKWEKLKRNQDRLTLRIRRFNVDLASIKENNPECADLPIKPIVLAEALTLLPPMPDWDD